MRIRLIEALSTDLICNTVIFTGIFLKCDQNGGVWKALWEGKRQGVPDAGLASSVRRRREEVI